MKTDRIFVLLLVVMLPMSGCFDDGVGDAEAAEDSTGTTVNHYNNTTVVNHHYHNNTTTVLQQLPEIISLGGVVENISHTGVSQYHSVAIFNSSAGEMIQLHEGRAHQMIYSGGLQVWSLDNGVYLKIQSTCDSAGVDQLFVYGPSQSIHNYEFLSGSAFDCTHELIVQDGSSSVSTDNISWSLTYSLIPTTVADAN